MKRLIIALCATIPAGLVGGCASYGYGAGVYAGGPYAYDGYYDDFYGPIYDGYWGDDGFFYYRNGDGDRHFRRGDAAHFSRGSPRGTNFHSMQGSMRPTRGMRMPHFGSGAPTRERGHH
jgi:hypothetical protein